MRRDGLGTKFILHISAYGIVNKHIMRKFPGHYNEYALNMKRIYIYCYHIITLNNFRTYWVAQQINTAISSRKPLALYTYTHFIHHGTKLA